MFGKIIKEWQFFKWQSRQHEERIRLLEKQQGGGAGGSFPGAVHSGAAMASEVSYPAERPHAWPAYVNLYRNVDGSLSIGQQVYVSPERAMGKISQAFAGNYIGCAPLDVEALARAAAKEWKS